MPLRNPQRLVSNNKNDRLKCSVSAPDIYIHTIYHVFATASATRCVFDMTYRRHFRPLAAAIVTRMPDSSGIGISIGARYSGVNISIDIRVSRPRSTPSISAEIRTTVENCAIFSKPNIRISTRGPQSFTVMADLVFTSLKLNSNWSLNLHELFMTSELSRH